MKVYYCHHSGQTWSQLTSREKVIKKKLKTNNINKKEKKKENNNMKSRGLKQKNIRSWFNKTQQSTLLLLNKKHIQKFTSGIGFRGTFGVRESSKR